MRAAKRTAAATDVELHLGEDWLRLAGTEPDIHALLEDNPSLRRTWDFLRSSSGVVFVVSPEQHLYRRVRHHLHDLRRDLATAGRSAQHYPIVFEVLHLDYDSPVATDDDVARDLKWPWMDRIDTETGPSVPEQSRRHDRPLLRLLEMIDKGPPTRG